MHQIFKNVRIQICPDLDEDKCFSNKVYFLLIEVYAFETKSMFFEHVDTVVVVVGVTIVVVGFAVVGGGIVAVIIMVVASLLS